MHFMLRGVRVVAFEMSFITTSVSSGIMRNILSKKFIINFFVVAVLCLLAVDVMRSSNSDAITIKLHGVDGFSECSEDEPFYVKIDNKSGKEVVNFSVDINAIDIGTGKSIFGEVSLYGDSNIKPGDSNFLCMSAGRSVSEKEMMSFEGVDLIVSNKTIGYLID